MKKRVVGVLAERMIDENRVALTPFDVEKLIESGIEVYIENGAGREAGFLDSDYFKVGAKATNLKEILKKSTLLVKFKAPQKEEYGLFKSHHTLLSYFHLDENIQANEIKEMMRGGYRAIAYEDLERDGKKFVLKEMSDITGREFVKKANEFFNELDYDEKPKRAFVIGSGNIAKSAIRELTTTGYKIFVLTRTIEAHKELNAINKNITLLTYKGDKTINLLSNTINQFDLILNCAVRRDRHIDKNYKYIIDFSMLKKMKPNSIICDCVAINGDVGGFIESTKSHKAIDYFFSLYNVIHYANEHIPTVVAKEASERHSSVIWEIVRDIALNQESEMINRAEVFSNQLLREDLAKMKA